MTKKVWEHELWRVTKLRCVIKEILMANGFKYIFFAASNENVIPLKILSYA